MRKVMAFGTFDIVHQGHLYYLQEAKKLGDYLIVVVARDKNSVVIKGKKPLHNEKARLEEIKKLDFVNEAVLGDREMRSWSTIQKHRPQIIALGYDQWKSEFSLAQELGKLGLHPMIVRIKPFQPEKFKTSKILQNKEK
ncbi:MAG: FAD synthase [Candidatus ainarchaeum sp.]|nr:FAD synthase [Candidatus ainarchaeum sp.]